jgi:hypothetical protein
MKQFFVYGTYCTVSLPSQSSHASTNISLGLFCGTLIYYDLTYITSELSNSVVGGLGVVRQAITRAQFQLLTYPSITLVEISHFIYDLMRKNCFQLDNLIR